MVINFERLNFQKNISKNDFKKLKIFQNIMIKTHNSELQGQEGRSRPYATNK